MVRRVIRVAEPDLGGNETEYVLDCLRSSWISSRGEYIERFEEMVASYCGVKHAVATNNGTTALHLALVALGVEPGDEVIVPTLTYIASANAVKYCGAQPVFVDCEPRRMTLDPTKIEACITPRTKGILSVPLYGHPVRFAEVQQVAEDHGLFVMEDAAEALGAKYQGRHVGSLGQCATFSFFGNKIITTGEGGMVVTNDPALAKRMRFLRGQGVSPDRCYWHTDIGFNYRMTNIAAAIGCAQMERVDALLQRRQGVATDYFRQLSELETWLVLPRASLDVHHCYWMFTVVLRAEAGLNRDEVIEQLAERGVETRPVFYPVHWMPPYEEPRGGYPVAEQHSSMGISLPTHGGLTEDDISYVCEQLSEVIRLQMGSVGRRKGRQAA